MKRVLKLLMLSCCFLVVTNVMAQKFGHTNSIELYSSLSEWKSAEKQLETYAAQLQNQLKTDEEAFYKDLQAFQKNIQAGLISQAQADQKKAEFQKREQSLLKKQQDAQKKASEKELALFGPIKDRVNNAIKGVMNDGNYAYIFDIAQGVIVPGPAGDDVTGKIKSKMGVQ